MSPPPVTVVVPTRDRPGALASCLAALAAQEGVGLDVVVVDDASADAESVAAVVGAAPGARLVRGAGRGPAAARNLGARTATTEVVCFTDDDCRPQPGWAAALAGRLEAEPGVAAAAGPTRTGDPGAVVAEAAQAVTNHLLESSLEPDGRLGFAPTCNLAVRADVLRQLPFDEAYPLAAGEDRDWCHRLTASGRRLVHVPAAVVDHHPDLDLRSFWRQQVRYGRGAARYRTLAGTGMAPARFYTGLLRRGFALGPRQGALVLLAQLATTVGLLQERATRSPFWRLHSRP